MRRRTDLVQNPYLSILSKLFALLLVFGVVTSLIELFYFGHRLPLVAPIMILGSIIGGSIVYNVYNYLKLTSKSLSLESSIHKKDLIASMVLDLFVWLAIGATYYSVALILF